MIKRRYKIEKLPWKNWIEIIDTKQDTSFWMHITDFGVTNKHLPKYCQIDAKKLCDLD